MAIRPSTPTTRRAWFELFAFVALLLTIVAMSRLSTHPVGATSGQIAAPVPAAQVAPVASDAHAVASPAPGGIFPAMQPPAAPTSTSSWPVLQLGGMGLSAFGLVVMARGRAIAMKSKLAASRRPCVAG